MPVNSSSTTNYLHFCTHHGISMYKYAIVAALKVLLLLPLSTFVLYLGHQRWRQHRSSKAATHSDIFTYNVAAVELLYASGFLCLYTGLYTHELILATAGTYVSSIPVFGETFFHILTCVERYLAVVHPITYRGLRNARCIKIRNICIGCVWLLSFGLASFPVVNLPEPVIILCLCILLFCIIIMSFCSLSVLCVLIRPGPGEGGRENQQLNQSKQRAFYTVTAISVAVWLWFVGLNISTVVSMTPMTQSVRCTVMSSISWLSLPSALVSPLLYLHRAGKLSCCC